MSPNLPRAAQRLLDAATAHGWATRADTSPGVYGHVTVRVSRPTEPRPVFRGLLSAPVWEYTLIWRRQYWLDPSGPLRLDGGYAHTPDLPASSVTAPGTVKSVCAVIAANPVTAGGAA